MTDYASEYPARLDPEPPTLADNVDAMPLDGLIWGIQMIQAIQDELGEDPADFTATGGFDYQSVGAFVKSRFRMESGKVTVPSTWVRGSLKVTFTADRFQVAPVVIVQAVEPSEPSSEATAGFHAAAKRITKDKFVIGTSRRSGDKTDITKNEDLQFFWLAFEPPFGIEETGDDADE